MIPDKLSWMGAFLDDLAFLLENFILNGPRVLQIPVRFRRASLLELNMGK